MDFFLSSKDSETTHMLFSFIIIILTLIPHSFATTPPKASTFAGSTSTAAYPPPNATVTNAASFFPNASQVGYRGPTATGDEAEAIVTAPSFARVDSIYPLVNLNPNTTSPFDITQHWGMLSPWKSGPSGLFGLDASPLIPPGCELTQVHLLHRHGARYPTANSTTPNFAGKVHDAAQRGFSASGPLEFLNTWKFRLGAAILTPFGRSELFNLGVGFRVKYGELLKDFKELPVFRTTSEARMVDSALNFAAGFFGIQTYQQDYHQLIMIEAQGFNSSLVPNNMCPNAKNSISAFGTVQANKWAAIYLRPTLNRLQSYVDGLDLEVADLIAMQQLCAYETVALGYSAFCDVFTEEEWKGFEYYIDLSYWYGSGPGNPASSAQGIGYVEEVVSRLTQTPITTPRSTVNVTIANNNITFPLNQPIYVDVSHDTAMSTIFVAMNFTSLAANGPLPTDHIPEHQTYFVNQIAPFATNLEGQVLSCPASGSPTHIRWILNDAVLPLTGMDGCKSNDDGLCELPVFIKAMQKRIEEVDFDFDCFGNYTIPSPDEIVNGQFPKS